MWKNCRFTIDHMIFRNPCFKLYCNNHCPDKFELTINLSTNIYPLWSKILIIVIVMSIAVLCILAKVINYCYYIDVLITRLISGCFLNLGKET